MISLSTNCYRVDAVKASCNQLKLQVPQQVTNQTGGNDAADNSAQRIANQQLRAVDQQVKANDADKAELALSAAKVAVTKASLDTGSVADKTSANDLNDAMSYARLGAVSGNQSALYGSLNVFA